MHQLTMDVFDVVETGDAVYADPPYRGQGRRYGGGGPDIARLIALMEAIAPRRALSISAPMLRDVWNLVPQARVGVWVKPFASFKPGVWPCYSWEPVVFWGDVKADRSMPTPKDHLVWPSGAGCRAGTGFVTPKPPEFADWIVRVLLPQPAGKRFVDLFSGSGAMGRIAESLGCDVIAVDRAPCQAGTA